MSAPYLHGQALALLDTLREIVERHGEVTLRLADLDPDTLGITLFGSLTVLLSAGLSDVEWRCTLAHEFEHLRRGPVPTELAEVEERAVELSAARRLLPHADSLGYLGDRWTARDVPMLAAHFEVDEDTMLSGLSPDTMPMLAVVPRTRPASA